METALVGGSAASAQATPMPASPWKTSRSKAIQRTGGRKFRNARTPLLQGTRHRVPAAGLWDQGSEHDDIVSGSLQNVTGQVQPPVLNSGYKSSQVRTDRSF